MADEAKQPDQPPEAPAPVVDPTPTSQSQAAPVLVDHLTRRDDNDALEGHFARVVDGDHAGQVGVFSQVIEYDQKTGYPALVLLNFRDATYPQASARVPYKALRPAAPYLGGR